jgi:adenylate cyclase
MNTPPVERTLAAILSADVAGYSRLMSLDEAGTLAALTAHREVIDGLIAERGGRIASTAGDSILAEFASVMAAVECGVEIQQAMAARNAELPDERKMLVRIGINVDDVMRKDEDIFGHGVNLAARLQGLAEPGGICISHGVRDQLHDKSPFVFEDQGKHSVKNIARPVHVFIVRFEGAPDAVAVIETAPPTEAEGSDGKADETELAFWSAIASSEVAADYTAYLERYPTGHFDGLARARLASLATGPSIGSDSEVKLQISYWESVKDSDDQAMFRAYLEKYPDGHFNDLARARLAQLQATA